ncbi:ATP-binding protein [Variovorax sp. LT2P21]|uniref:PAS domain-containing sensor histidine kinase n=1 Tax=Variovorax sp. LT2P21 TaxID=3443731 RepID=UPI003F467E19
MDAALPEPESLYEEAPCGLLVTATDGTILKVNATFCGWVGHSAAELVGHKRVADLLTIGGRIFHQTHWVPTLQLQGSLAEVKFDVLHSNGTTVPMILNARRRQRGEGEFDEIAAFSAQDRHRYERELMNARKRADALLEVERESKQLLKDRALFAEQMVGIVSHDLRNPLSAILMGVKLLGRFENERGVRVLGHVRSSAERAQRLIEDLLDFTQARVGSGLAVTLRPADLHEVTGRTVEELRLAFPDQDILHRATGPGGCTADADRLAQLIVNLVSNAAMYGEVGAPITVASEVAADTAMLAVHNEGAPIAAETLEKLFEPLVRGVPGSSHVRSVGLGLFIVREIARAHGGTMTVRSLPRTGTSFLLSFPATAVG